MKEALQKLWANSYFRGFVRAAEGGAVVGFLEATASGFHVSWRSLAATVGGGVVVSIRNWLLTSPLNPSIPVQEPPKEQK